MTKIESGVTVSKGLFAIYGNAKIVTAKIFLVLTKKFKNHNIVSKDFCFSIF
jgi:hypothetical protein